MRKTTNESTAFKQSGYNFGAGAYSSGGKSKALMAKSGGIQSMTHYGVRPGNVSNISKSVNKKFLPLRDQGKLVIAG